MSTKDTIVIFDFGSQFTQLIARRVRELNIYSDIVNHSKLRKFKSICEGTKLKFAIHGELSVNFFVLDNIEDNKEVLKRDIEILIIDMGEIPKLIKSGQINHSLVITAFYLLKDYNL